jgi:hypothetical protein
VQVGIQVWCWKKFYGLKVPPLEEQPTSMEEFLRRQMSPWPADDVREPGRQMWEHFLRRLIPEDLPIPDYLLAPILVAAGTVPIQFLRGERIRKDDQESTAPSAPVAAAA